MVNVSVILKAKPVSETVTDFHVSACTSSKMNKQALVRSASSGGRQRMWLRWYWRNGMPVAELVRFGVIFLHFQYARTELLHINGTSNATQYHGEVMSRHLQCCRTGMLWVTKLLPSSFCKTKTAHPTQARRVTAYMTQYNAIRMLSRPAKAPDLKYTECLYVAVCVTSLSLISLRRKTYSYQG